MSAIQSRVPQGVPSGGQFSSAARPDGDPIAAPTFRVTAADGTEVELDPSRWSNAAEEVFMQGQCLAFAAAVARDTDLPIRVAMSHSGSTLVHAWVDDCGTVLDAMHTGVGDWATEEMIRDESYASWGDLDVFDLPLDDVEGWYLKRARGTTAHDQAWDAATAMIPAWREHHGI